MRDDVQIAENFAGQARLAADDPRSTDALLRQGLRDAASIIEAQRTEILHRDAWLASADDINSNLWAALVGLGGVVIVAVVLIAWFAR